MRREDYAALGGHVDSICRIEDVTSADRLQVQQWHAQGPWPGAPLPRGAAE
jgi:hypothetical protein